MGIKSNKNNFLGGSLSTKATHKVVEFYDKENRSSYFKLLLINDTDSKNFNARKYSSLPDLAKDLSLDKSETWETLYKGGSLKSKWILENMQELTKDYDIFIDINDVCVNVLNENNLDRSKFKSKTPLNRDQFINLLVDSQKDKSVSKILDVILESLNASKLNKFSDNHSRIFTFLLFTQTLVGQWKAEYGSEISTPLIGLVSKIYQVIRDSNLSKDPVIYKFLKLMSLEKLSDSEITDEISKGSSLAINNSGLVKLFKLMRTALIRALSGTPISLVIQKLKAHENVNAIIESFINQVNNVTFKQNKSGKKTKELKRAESQELAVRIRIEEIFNSFGETLKLFDGAEPKFKNTLVVSLASLLNFSRSIYIEFDTSSKEVVDELTGSLVGRGSEVLSTSEVLDVIPELPEVLLKLFEGINTFNFKTDYKLIDDAQSLFVTNKNGPNFGLPSMISLSYDSVAVNNDEEVKNHILAWYDALGITGVQNIMDQYVNDPKVKERLSAALEDSNTKQTDAFHSKLSIFPDKEGKKRIVALGDWYTQTALKSLNDVTKEWIKSDKCKFIQLKEVYDQDGAQKRMHQASLNSGESRDSDLTAATDYMQLSAQKITVEVLMKELTGKTGFGELWGNLVSKRTFKVLKDGKFVDVRYAQGQPMGFISSWLVMHITHVAISEIALRRTIANGAPKDSTYAVIGDDNHQNRDGVYREYIAIQEQLHQPMSIEKNILSNKTKDREVFSNFLKVWSYGELAFRPISFNIILNFFKNPKHYIFGLIKELFKITRFVHVYDYFRIAMRYDYLKNKGKEDYNFKESSLDLFQQLYVWLHINKSLGGMNLPYVAIRAMLRIDISYLASKFGARRLTDETLIWFYNRGVLTHFKAQEDVCLKNLRTLLSLGKEVNIFNKLMGDINRKFPDVVDDYTELWQILCNSKAAPNWGELPIHRIMYEWLITNRSELKAKKKEYADASYNLTTRAGRFETTASDVIQMYEIYRTYKSFNIRTVSSIVTMTELNEDVEVRGINSGLMKSLMRTETNRVKRKRAMEVKSIVNRSLDDFF